MRISDWSSDVCSSDLIPVFDDGTPTRIPVGRGIQLEAVGTRQSISEGIDVNGTPMSLDDILASAISAVESGDDAARTNALGAVETGVAHVINEQANQGIRADRLSSTAEKDRQSTRLHSRQYIATRMPSTD